MNAIEDLTDAALDLPLQVEAVLDRCIVKIGELLDFRRGSIIRTSRAAGENVHLLIGGVHIADGDLVATDTKISVRISELHDK